MRTSIKNNKIVVSDILVKEIRNIFLKYGKEKLNENIDLIRNDLLHSEIDLKDTNIIILIFSCSNILSYLIKDKISEIEINSIYISICDKCGLDQSSAQYYLNAILLGFGFASRIDYEYNNILERNSERTGFSYDLKGDRYSDKLNKIETAINNKDEDFFAKQDFSVLFNRMVIEHNPRAMFLLGRCYFEGIGTSPNVEKAKKYVLMASEAGLPDANAYLGDILYNNRDFSQAFNYYTAIGSTALSAERKNRLSTILDFDKTNKRMIRALICSSILSILMFVFMMTDILAPFKASGKTIVFLPVIGIILTVVILMSALLFNRNFKYNSVGRYVIAVFATMIIISLLFVIF